MPISYWRDRGICWLCHQPVLEGQARHGSNGGHWECNEKLDEDMAAIFGKTEARETGLYKARAAGGGLFHMVDKATGAALCGHKPKNNARHMRDRGRWIPIKDEYPVTCRGCIKASVKAQIEEALK